METFIIIIFIEKVGMLIIYLYQRRIGVICLALLYRRKCTCIERWLDV